MNRGCPTSRVFREVGRRTADTHRFPFPSPLDSLLRHRAGTIASQFCSHVEQAEAPLRRRGLTFPYLQLLSAGPVARTCIEQAYSKHLPDCSEGGPLLAVFCKGRVLTALTLLVFLPRIFITSVSFTRTFPVCPSKQCRKLLHRPASASVTTPPFTGLDS